MSIRECADAEYDSSICSQGIISTMRAHQLSFRNSPLNIWQMP